MDEYISKESSISIFRAKEEMAVCTPAQPYFERAAKMLELLPAADVAPVRYGQWNVEWDAERDQKRLFVRIVCSNCGLKTGQKSNYCPNCGARMDLEV